jgi:pimeloyl-ACP methyl ester carboxylesterase
MAIKKARNGAIEIAYEYFGSPEGTPLLLINGSGMQMVMWPVDLITALVERGFQVVRFDSRDSGLSTWLTDVRKRRAYGLRELAGDVIAVMDDLGWSGAQLLGGSMGGLIAQNVAIHHPDRVTGLTLLFCGAGSKLRLAKPKFRTVLKAVRLMSRKVPDAEAYGERWVTLMHLVGTPPIDEDHWRTAGRVAYQRGLYLPGNARHTLAEMGAGDLRPRLAELTMPALVVHGEADPMQSWKAGKIVADSIPGARFMLVPGMRHDLPRTIWPEVIDAMCGLASPGTPAGSG